MLHAGIGPTDLNNLLTTMNLPEISHRSLKQWEDEIGSVLETYAQNSANSALHEEKNLTEMNNEVNRCFSGCYMAEERVSMKLQ